MKIMTIFCFFQRNIRYFLASLAILTTFFISRSFPAQVVTSQSCGNGNCIAMLETPSLSKKNTAYYVNNVLEPGDGRYYRLTFRARANKDTEIVVKITNPMDEDKEMKIIKLNKSFKNLPHEIVFFADRNYSDILFQKRNINDEADTVISGVQISPLEIKSDQELSNLKPTIRGELDTNEIDQAQQDNSYSFSQLKEPDIIFGQIFKPNATYLTSVTLDMDIIKQDNNGGKKYKFEVREAEYDGEVPEVTSNVISSVDFTINNIETYRQNDGKFKFPTLAKLDPSKYYFIGINNNNVAVDEFNHLRIKGTRNREKYTKGTLAVKTKGRTYAAVGNLYFITYQMSFNQFQGKKILGGGVIEDLGKSRGLYTYNQLGSLYDLADLEDYSSDVEYDDDQKALTGVFKPGTESFMVYKLETIFPASGIRIRVKQPDKEWSKIAILYSYDAASWKEIPGMVDDAGEFKDTAQYYYYSWDLIPSKDKIYIKIIPQEPGGKEKYGISDFKVEATISMK